VSRKEPDRAVSPLGPGPGTDAGPRVPSEAGRDSGDVPGTIRLEGPPPPPPRRPPPRPPDPLALALEDPTAEGRLAAVHEAGAEPAGGQAALLLKTIASDASAAVRLAAVTAFRPRPRDERLRAAATAISDPDPEVRVAAVGMLDGRSGPAAAVLVRALRDSSDEVVRKAAGLLAGSDHPAGLAILWSAALDAAHPNRARIVEAIESFADAARTLARAALESMDAVERACGLDVLARLGDEELPELVTEALSDTSPTVRVAALRAVPGVTAVDVDAVGERVHDPDEEVRRLAVEALAGVDDDRVLVYLIDACHDPARAIRDAAGDAVVDRRSVPLVRLLIRALDKPHLRATAAGLLARMGSVAARELVDAIEDADSETRDLIGEILTAAGARRALLVDLRDRRPEQRRRAMEALALMEMGKALDPLVERLQDPDGMVRARAASILGDIGDSRAVPALTRVASFDPDVEVVAAAELALKRLKRPRVDKRSR
jgi:HEAT repeat protein